MLVLWMLDNNNKKKNMKTEKIFTFRLPADLLDAAHVLATARDLSLAQLMRRLVKDAVAKEVLTAYENPTKSKEIG